MRLLWGTVTALIFPCRVLAAEGETPVNLLTRVESTRAQAFGGGAVAVGNDPTLVWVNPAAAAGLAQGSVTAGGNRGLFGDLTGQALVTTPLRGGQVTAGLLYYDAGEIENYTSTGQLWRVRPQQDVMGTVGYARALNAIVSSGVTVKYLRSRLAGTGMGALAGDFGAQVRLGRAVKLGAAVLNVGTPLTYHDASLALPTIVRAGAAAAWQFASPGAPGRFDTLIVVADLDHHPLEGVTAVRGGLEYQWRGMIALRAGARTGAAADAGVFAGGVGLRIGAYRLDWTIRHNDLADLPQTLSLTVHFGGARAAAGPAAVLSPSAPPTTNAVPVSDPATIPLPDRQPVLLPAPVTATRLEDPAPPRESGPIEDLNRQLDRMLQDGPQKK